MGRINTTGFGHWIAVGTLALAGAFLWVVPAHSISVETQATYASSGFGFNMTNLGGLPFISVDTSAEFLSAGLPELGLAVELIGTKDVCILSMGDNVCQPAILEDLSNVSSAFSVLTTFRVRVNDTAKLPGEFTLVLTGLGTKPDPSENYDFSEVSIELQPSSPMDHDTSAVPLFDAVFDGSFSPFVRIHDVALQDMGFIDDYIGWTVSDGDFVTFRYEVSQVNFSGLPILQVSAVTTVVPEPGTALLFGFGLVGLSVRGAKRRPTARSSDPS